MLLTSTMATSADTTFTSTTTSSTTSTTITVFASNLNTTTELYGTLRNSRHQKVFIAHVTASLSLASTRKGNFLFSLGKTLKSASASKIPIAHSNKNIFLLNRTRA
jgi:hypothetical protein